MPGAQTALGERHVDRPLPACPPNLKLLGHFFLLPQFLKAVRDLLSSQGASAKLGFCRASVVRWMLPGNLREELCQHPVPRPSGFGGLFLSAVTQKYFLPVLFTVWPQRGPLSFCFSFKSGFNH